MIPELRRLHFLLDALEYEVDDPALGEAIEIVEKLIVAHEKPLPVPTVGLCYRVPTPVPPAPPAPVPPAPVVAVAAAAPPRKRIRPYSPRKKDTAA